MRYIFLLICLSFMACQKTFHYLDAAETQSSETISLEDFDLYAYAICEFDSDKSGVTAIENCPDTNDRSNIIEEIYLLYPKKAEENSRVVLISTLSFVRHPKREFGRDIYKQSAVISDIDFLFVGRVTGNTIEFKPNVSTKKLLNWEIKKNKDKIEIVSVPYLEARDGDPKRFVVSEVLKGGVSFTKQDRNLAFQYKKNKPRKGCEEGKPILSCKAITINHESNRDRILFVMNNTTNCPDFNHIVFWNRRLWYYDWE